MNELTVVIQAGGESKRMGKPKALASFCGGPLICRSLKRLGSCADEIIITSNDQKSLDFLCESVTFDNKLRLCSDVYNVRNALNGIYTALYSATSPFVAMVACDMIFPSAPLLLAERDILVETGGDIAVPHTSHGFEPFHAVYRRATCLPVVQAALLDGETRATGWFDKVRVEEVSSEMLAEIDPRGGSFINVNTPDELAAIEKRILDGRMTKIGEGQAAHPSVITKPSCGWKAI
ncbi:MAG: molybdenum cofactor guanylyltransferase [Coriobacteriales bacterium]|jgi:molybdopterin-guanine dinucleotide biosynthesis protein A|nr:molybdenum cofactor guanylyltransferase [Coriobacteriales bacterium]